MDVQAYLDRIGYRGPLTVTAETLRALQVAHLQAIPFENLSIHAWQPQYRFTLQPYEYADYAGMCHYHQTSPESHFTQRTLCSLATPEGRVTLSGMRLITTRGKERHERTLESEEERAALLRELFGVVV